jgi:hypothetical protein
MKKIFLFLALALTIVSCSTPQERADIVSDYGEVIWRSHPTSHDMYETFICMDNEKHLWIISVTDGGLLSDANKINNYNLILDTTRTQ